MTKVKFFPLTVCLFCGIILTQISVATAKDIIRPEKIRSKREVIYEKETYEELAKLRKEYNKEFPSEDAYANWMYAARYAGDEGYDKLLKRGLKKYPANPTILYLSSMLRHGAFDNDIERNYLERATQLDPEYMDPWFSLVIHYMQSNDDERLRIALRYLLEGGAVAEEIMDYSYNMLASFAENAILITNGDNDTYPGFILTDLLNFRPDVLIVNRSLLNTDWYPTYMVEKGLPRFISKRELEDLRENILTDLKAKKTRVGPGGPFGDTLIVRLIESATKEERPVYLAHTLYESDVVKRYRGKGRQLGLVTLATPPTKSYKQEMRELVTVWLEEFRTGGLDSWRLHHSKKGDAALPIMTNYAAGLYAIMDSAANELHDSRLDLFHWYEQHLEKLFSEGKIKNLMMEMWCRFDDIEEIKAWCESQRIKK
jgi:hypothetical protein